MEPLGIIGEVRTQVKSFKQRYEKFREGKARFRSLTGDVDLLLKYITEVERLRQKSPRTLPTESATLFEDTLAHVRDSFIDLNTTVLPKLAKAFEENGSGTKDERKQQIIQVTQANALSASMDALEKKIQTASNKLQHLITALLNALTVEENVMPAINAIFSTMQANHGELLLTIGNLQIAEAEEEVYRPATSTPTPSHTVMLDFCSKDENGDSPTPEGKVRQAVLESSQVVSAYGIVGMAGVGKTVALQGLGHDEEVKKRFTDGVHYMTFGRDATLEKTIDEIAKIMESTGATTKLKNVRNASSVKDAVDYAVMWFKGKICLYLLDDLWPSEKLPGYFQDLRQLVRGSPDSRMVISTRSFDLASEAGRVVGFGPRDPLGSASVDIFMAHATVHLTQASSTADDEISPSVRKILAICGGLPIALSVTGCGVSKDVLLCGTFDKGTFDRACDEYAAKLERKKKLLVSENTTYGTSLNAGIVLSLEHLEVGFAKLSLQTDHDIFDLYVSLCVLSSQAWVPVSVLVRMWQLDKEAALDVVKLFCGMSLAKLERRRPSINSREEDGIMLHDLLLEFCQHQAVKKKKTSSFWHAQLLNGYLAPLDQPIAEDPNVPVTQAITRFVPRPWWADSVSNDGYIHSNLSTHLARAGHGMELAALLLDARWMELRDRIGGILALKTDFENLESFLKSLESSREEESVGDEVRQGLEQISKAVQLSWGRRMKGRRLFQFHVCGRLARVRKSNSIVDAFLKRVEMITPKPYLLPVSSFFPELDSALMFEVPVSEGSVSVACSPCGRYIAARSQNEIFVLKCSSGEILRRRKGPYDEARCIGFLTGSKKVVLRSNDGKIMLWEWELPEAHAQVLEEHSDGVRCVAVHGDRGQIFSTISHDGTVKIWDSTTGAQTWELPKYKDLNCAAVCAEGRKIALGLGERTLKVVDFASKRILFEDSQAHERPVACIAFSPNGSYLVAGSEDGTILMWHTRDWTRVAECFKGHASEVKCAVFSPDGKHVASSSRDGTIRVWDVESGKCIGTSPETKWVITSVSFTADRERIVSGLGDGIVQIWDACLDRESKQGIYGHTRGVIEVAISPNGDRAASASLDGTIRLWDAKTGEQVGVPLEGHEGTVYCISFSPNGRQVVSGSRDNTVRLWDTKRQTQIGGPFRGHTWFVRGVSFCSDGNRIISGSNDGTVRIWSTESQKQIGRSMKHDTLVVRVSESADGCYIVSQEFSKTTSIWNRRNLLVWRSDEVDENEITEARAKEIINGCGQHTPHLWPESFPEYTSELGCKDGSVYANVGGEKTLIADTMLCYRWTYDSKTRLFCAGLRPYGVVICNLIIE